MSYASDAGIAFGTWHTGSTATGDRRNRMKEVVDITENRIQAAAPRRRKAARVCFLLSLLWMVFIFMMSQQNADVSTETSLRAGTLVAELVVPGYRDWTAEEQRALAMQIDYPVRKLAHASEYTVLGILYSLSVLSVTVVPKRRRLLCTAFPLGVLYAASDELHQLFVPGRAGRVSDVLIDSSGVLLGIAIVSLFMHIKQFLKTKSVYA